MAKPPARKMVPTTKVEGTPIRRINMAGMKLAKPQPTPNRV